MDGAGTGGPVLPGAAVLAGFEIAVLLRCARTGSGRYGRGANPVGRVARVGVSRPVARLSMPDIRKGARQAGIAAREI